MRISKIDISNYRGFKNCKVDFHPSLNILIGSNASGKTTLLTAIVKTLYSLTASFAPPAKHNPELSIKNGDANYSEKYCTLISLIEDFPGYNKKIATILNTNPLTAPSKEFIELNDSRANFTHWLSKEIAVGPITIPILKFYPANRGAITYSRESYPINYQISQLETWGNIYQDTLSYSKFFKWFLENETNELLLQRDKRNFDLQSPALRDVRTALNRIFEFMGYGKSKIKVKQIKREGSSELIPTLVLEYPNSQKEESLDNKSDGEKAIITLVADIAYNLSLAKDFVQNDDFLQSPGIVLIDEIETHLHPNWQRQIMPMLITIFPNIQFFVTTHSPQIISSVKSESVFSMENFNIRRIHLKTLGEDSNSLLKFVFDSTERPNKYVDLLEKFDLLIEQKADDKSIEGLINEIRKMEEEDNSQTASNLISNLILQMEAYKFDRENEKSN